MATNFTGGDALAAFAGGALEEVMRRRKLREAQAQQTALLAQQQAGATQRTQIEQGGLTDRTNAIQSGLTTRDTNNPAPKIDPNDPSYYPEWLRRREADYQLKQKYAAPHAGHAPAGDKEKDPYQKVKDKKLAWSKWLENTRRGDKPDIYGHTPSHLTGGSPAPTYGGHPLPADKWDEVAQAAVEQNVPDQKAADMIYARDETVNAAESYHINPEADAIDVNRLRSLPSMKGRSINFGDENGKTNLATLFGVLVGSAGWSHQEMSDLLDEYFGISRNPGMDVIQNPTGVNNP